MAASDFLKIGDLLIHRGEDRNHDYSKEVIHP